MTPMPTGVLWVRGAGRPGQMHEGPASGHAGCRHRGAQAALRLLDETVAIESVGVLGGTGGPGSPGGTGMVGRGRAGGAGGAASGSRTGAGGVLEATGRGGRGGWRAASLPSLQRVVGALRGNPLPGMEADGGATPHPTARRPTVAGAGGAPTRIQQIEQIWPEIAGQVTSTAGFGDETGLLGGQPLVSARPLFWTGGVESVSAGTGRFR